MFVAVDLTNLVFLHKHSEQRVVSMLADLEAPHVAVRVIPFDHYAGFTDYELLKLYHNTTGSNIRSFFRPGLELVCTKAAAALPETDAVAFEVDIQRRAVPEGDRGRYQYVKGSMQPRPVDELFPSPVLRGTIAPADE